MASRERGEYIGAAPDAEIVAVKLNRARPYYLEYYLVPPEQENVFESTSVMVGIEYIVQQARKLNRPVAICLGVGTNLGTHDGFSQLEQYLDHVANISGICVVTAIGNESQARHHMRGTVSETGGSSVIDINCSNLGSNIYTSIINPVSDRISVSIKSPSGEVVGRIPAKSGTTLTTSLIFERSRITVEYYYPVTGSSGQVTIVKIQDATPGIWSITINGDIIKTAGSTLPAGDGAGVAGASSFFRPTILSWSCRRTRLRHCRGAYNKQRRTACMSTRLGDRRWLRPTHPT